MVDEGEWAWIVDHARGAYDHLIIASTLPVFMVKGIHYLEAWNEALCGGAWGAARGARWARGSGGRSTSTTGPPSSARSRSMVALLAELARGGRREPPASITLIGGDVHTAYVAEVALGDGQRSRVHQVVCSPFRNPLDPRERRMVRLMSTRAAGAARGRSRARPASRRPAADWRFPSGPTFDNSVAVLELETAGRADHDQPQRPGGRGRTSPFGAAHPRAVSRLTPPGPSSTPSPRPGRPRRTAGEQLLRRGAREGAGRPSVRTSRSRAVATGTAQRLPAFSSPPFSAVPLRDGRPSERDELAGRKRRPLALQRLRSTRWHPTAGLRARSTRPSCCGARALLICCPSGCARFSRPPTAGRWLCTSWT